MSRQSCVHSRTDNPEVVLLLQHIILERLFCSLLLTGVWINDVLLRWMRILSFGQWIRWWIGTALFLGKAEIDEVDEMSFSGVVTNDYVGWFQISVDVALGVDGLESVH